MFCVVYCLFGGVLLYCILFLLREGVVGLLPAVLFPQPWGGVGCNRAEQSLFVLEFCLACELPLNSFFFFFYPRLKKNGKMAGKLALLVGREREKERVPVVLIARSSTIG